MYIYIVNKVDINAQSHFNMCYIHILIFMNALKAIKALSIISTVKITKS